MRKVQDLHWGRHDQAYRRGKLQSHASYWALTHQIHPGGNQGRGDFVAVARPSRDLVARRRADRCAALIARMYQDRQRLLGQIAACSSSRRDDWLGRLDRIEPTAPGAEAALGELCDEIEHERRRLAAAPCRGWSQPSSPEPPELSWPTFGTLHAELSLLGLSELALSQDEADADLETLRARCENTLATIVSRIHALASPVRRYQAGAF